MATVKRTAVTPSAPASVGVATPKKIDPRTARIMANGRMTVLRETNFSFRVNFSGWTGHSFGLI